VVIEDLCAVAGDGPVGSVSHACLSVGPRTYVQGTCRWLTYGEIAAPRFNGGVWPCSAVDAGFPEDEARVGRYEIATPKRKGPRHEALRRGKSGGPGGI